MENWAAFLLGAVLTGIITLPIAIFGNLITPWVKSYFERRKLTTRERELFAVLSYYRQIEFFTLNPIMLVLWTLRLMLVTFTFFGFMIIVYMLVFPIIWDNSVLSHFDSEPFRFISILGLLGIFIYSMVAITKTITDAMNFNAFRDKTSAQLIKLGGNPEELDKIDKEIEEKKEG